MFIHEKPLGENDVDELGREGYAEYLAESLSSYTDPKNSLVVALYGPWGSGKSSLWTLIKRKIDSKKTLIVDYNPWEFSQQDEILKSFFLRLHDKIKSDDAKLASEILHYFYTFLKHSNALLQQIKENFDNIAITIAAIGLLGGFSIPEDYKKYWFSVILLLIPSIKLLLFIIMKYFNNPGDNIEKAKKKIAEQVEIYFKKKGKNFLIVIDDIDRLSTEQIKLIFQIVKVNADFPRTTYLLLFDREIIEKTFDDNENGIKGSNYIEKITQVGLDIPEINLQFLHSYIGKKIKDLLGQKNLLPFFDSSRWDKLFGNHLCFYFENLRDAKRFLNSLDFHLSFLTQKHCEIDPVDFISLEILRVFEPKLYHLLPENRSLFVFKAEFMDIAHHQRLYTGASSGLTTPEDIREYFIQLIRESINGTEKNVFETLKELFPPILTVLRENGANLSNLVQETFENRRVCHDYNFDWYFQYQNPLGLSKEEIENIYNNVKHREVLTGIFKQLLVEGRLHRALNFLEISIEQLSLDGTETFIISLLDLESYLECKWSGFKSSPQDLILAIIKASLRKNIPDLSERAVVLKGVFSNSNALYIPMDLVVAWFRYYLSSDKSRQSTPPLLNSEGVDELKEFLLAKINKESDLSIGSLRTHKFIAILLDFWKYWTSPDIVKTWTGELIEEESGLWQLLMGFYKSYFADIGLKDIHNYVDIALLKTKIRQLSSQNLTEEQNRLLEAFNGYYDMGDQSHTIQREELTGF